MSAPTTTPVQAGSLIAGRYRVTREIGRGGMAQVYEGEHVDIGRRVAIKVLSAEFASSTVVVERFLREARAAAAVRSPYICDVFDSGKLDDTRPFLVMELLEGESLYERMVRVRQFDPRTTLKIVVHVSRGLMKAHAANVVHRDLKPENIFLTVNEDGELHAKVLDFGLAKFYAPVADTGPQARLTREGAIFGTPAYMSPEQVKGQGAVDHRADLWALGCIVYECFTGRTVWSTEQGVAMTFAQIANAPLPRLLRYRPDLPPALEEWFQKALSRDINERFQSAKELADALSDALACGPPSLILQTGEGPAGARISHGSLPPARASDRRANEAARASETTGERAAARIASGPSQTDASPSAPVLPLLPVPPGPGPSLPRVHAASLVETGTSSSVDERPIPSTPRPSRAPRRLAALVGVVALAAGGYFGWKRWYSGTTTKPTIDTASLPASSVSSSASPSSPPNAPLPPVNVPPPRWLALVSQAQGQVAQGDLEGAAKSLHESLDASGSGESRTLSEHVAAAIANRGPCRLTAIGRLRPPQLQSGHAGRPVLVRAGGETLALWADDHESSGHDHIYSMTYDGALRPIGGLVDVTPEADDVGRVFAAESIGERVALLYGDGRGPRPGLFLRWLDAKGRIDASPIMVAPARAGGSAPALIRDGRETLWALWEEERDGDSVDLVMRKLSTSGPAGGELRLTDFGNHAGKSRATSVTGASMNGALELLFRLERENARPVMHVFLPAGDPALSNGLPGNPSGARGDRAVGALRTLTPERDKGDSPSVACTGDGCYVVWHAEKQGVGAGGGAYAAYLDGRTGQMIWRKKFAASGGRPTVSVGVGGLARVAWYEGSRLRTATVGREGVGPASSLARVVGDQPRPSVIGGADATDWSIAWLDFEASHLEPYALRASCQSPSP